MRSKFDFSTIPLFISKTLCYPRHMNSTLKHMTPIIQNHSGIILEVRDARIPFSSTNPEFSSLFPMCQRITVYNKQDLSCPQTNKMLTVDGSFLISTHLPSSIRSLLNYIIHIHHKSDSKRIFVIGIPNVGKSSLINAFRRMAIPNQQSKLQVSKKAGTTRSLWDFINLSLDPKIKIADTPGILPPRHDDMEVLFKIAITGGFPQDISNYSIYLSDYLLFLLNYKCNNQYIKYYDLLHPIDDIQSFLSLAAKRLNMYKKHGQLDIERASIDFIDRFRSGQFGRMTIDDLSNTTCLSHSEKPLHSIQRIGVDG